MAEEHSLFQLLREAAVEGQRRPTPHLLSFASSNLLWCCSLGKPTRNLRARGPKRGREWICVEKGTNGKTPTWRKEEVKEQGNSEGMEAKAAAIFWERKRMRQEQM